jgi:hypothetical protein
MGLNENIKAHRLEAKHGGSDEHSLVHDSPLGSRYQVRIDVWGADHVEQAERIVRAVNAHETLVSAVRQLVACVEAGTAPGNSMSDGALAAARAALSTAEGRPE